MKSLLEKLLQVRWHLLMLVLGLIVLALSFTQDWRYLFAYPLLVAAWLLVLGKIPSTLSLENGEVLMRNDLGWVVARASLDGVIEVILYLRPIPPGAQRMDVRNSRLHIDTSRVQRLGISDFCEQIKALGLPVDSSRLRKGAFDKKAPRKIKIRFPGSR